jgi:hypothetical protein
MDLSQQIDVHAVGSGLSTSIEKLVDDFSDVNAFQLVERLAIELLQIASVQTATNEPL